MITTTTTTVAAVIVAYLIVVVVVQTDVEIREIIAVVKEKSFEALGQKIEEKKKKKTLLGRFQKLLCKTT